MSRFLLVSYYFPPIGGAGAQRPVKFARYLLDQGHRATVVTGPGPAGDRWTPADPTLSLDIPSEVEVVRLDGPEPGHPGVPWNRVQRLTRYRDRWARWWQHGVVAVGSTLPRPDAIYTIMSPYASAEASRALARRLGVGWIADIGDPWALDEMMVYPTEVHRRLELARMRRLLSSAAAVVTTTPECARQVVEAFPELAGRPVMSVPNGYDAADFAGEVVPRSDGKFRIVHTGYLHTELGLQQRQTAAVRRWLGGSVAGVDILTRSHVFLLEAVERLLAGEPGLSERLEVHFAGVLSETDRRFAERVPVSVLHGYLSHAESIALMRSADLLFLPMQNLPPGRRSSTVPGKTYEYLAAGRPILGAVPPGDTRDILVRAGHEVCEPNDVEAMAQALRKAVDANDDGLAPRPIDWEFVRGFERRELTRQMAEVIRAVAETRSAPHDA